MIYEFITPSDPITFIANDDKVAFAVGLIAGGGNAGVERVKDYKSLDTLLMFADENQFKEIVKKNLGVDTLNLFVEDNKKSIIDALDSFMYGGASERNTYDDAISAITDPVKLKAFKASHEDRQRSSCSELVKYAWQCAENLRKMA